MRLVIVGATSFIGENLINALKSKKWDIIGVVRENSARKKDLDIFSNLSIVECNMNNYDKLGQLLGKVDCLVYLTWNGTRGLDRNNYIKQRENYEKGIAAIKSVVKIGCTKILTAGSQAEYGPWFKREKISEEEDPNPNTEYGKFKLKFYEAAKKICEKNNVNLIEPRFFSLYGPNDYEGTMIISTLKKMLKNVPCDLTKCIQWWDFLYITDAIDGVIKLIEENHNDGVYNFGSGDSHQLKYYIQKLYNITESKSKLNYGGIAYPATGIVNVNPCVDKLKGIGWSPVVSFSEGIHKVIEALK